MLCEIIKKNADALSDEKQITDLKSEIERQLKASTDEVTGHGGSTPAIEDRYRSKLGYWIYRNAGRWHGLKVLLSDF